MHKSRLTWHHTANTKPSQTGQRLSLRPTSEVNKFTSIGQWALFLLNTQDPPHKTAANLQSKIETSYINPVRPRAEDRKKDQETILCTNLNVFQNDSFFQPKLRNAQNFQALRNLILFPKDNNQLHPTYKPFAFLCVCLFLFSKDKIHLATKNKLPRHLYCMFASSALPK